MQYFVTESIWRNKFIACRVKRKARGRTPHKVHVLDAWGSPTFLAMVEKEKVFAWFPTRRAALAFCEKAHPCPAKLDAPEAVEQRRAYNEALHRRLQRAQNRIKAELAEQHDAVKAAERAALERLEQARAAAQREAVELVEALGGAPA